jgi:ABC-2 type transport system ATP-binding protein
MQDWHAGIPRESGTGGRSQLVVDVPDAPPGWARGLAGVTVIDDGDAGPAVPELTPGADDQVVLKAAMTYGPVREFARRRPCLTELFRHLVREEGEKA